MKVVVKKWIYYVLRNAVDGVKTGAGGKGINSNVSPDGNGPNSGNEAFNKHYNKELKVSEGKYRFLLYLDYLT